MSKSKLTKFPSLEDCQTGLRQQAAHLNNLAKKATYRAIAIGLWALKAREIYLSATDARRLPNGQLGGAEGFDAWLQTATEGCLSRRTGYNYMNAAQNAGLTASSTLEDVEEMEKRDALADRKLTAHDLYSPPRLQEGSPEDLAAQKKLKHIQRPEVKAQQEWFPFYEQLAFYGTDEKETNLLYHLPLTSVDPTKEVSLNDLEQNLENALARVREIKKERIQSLKSAA